MADQPRDRLGRFLSPDKNKSHLNFNQKFGGPLGDFLEAAEKAGRNIGIKSGYRSVARQKQLFDAAVKKYGSVKAARKMVAPPGLSQHNLGTAADLSYGSKEDIEWAHANAKKYGLNFRMPWENWHIEPLGTLGKLGLGLADLINPQPNPNLPAIPRAGNGPARACHAGRAGPLYAARFTRKGGRNAAFPQFDGCRAARVPRFDACRARPKCTTRCRLCRHRRNGPRFAVTWQHCV
jgi:hypothetical protein